MLLLWLILKGLHCHKIELSVRGTDWNCTVKLADLRQDLKKETKYIFWQCVKTGEKTSTSSLKLVEKNVTYHKEYQEKWKKRERFVSLVKNDMKLVRREYSADCWMETDDWLWSPPEGNNSKEKLFGKIIVLMLENYKNNSLARFTRSLCFFPVGSCRLGSSDGGGCGVQTRPTAGLPDIHGCSELWEGH